MDIIDQAIITLLKDFLSKNPSSIISGTLTIIITVYHFYKRNKLNSIREKESNEYRDQLLILANNISLAISTLSRVKSNLESHCSDTKCEHHEILDQVKQISLRVENAKDISDIRESLKSVQDVLTKVKNRIDVSQELIKNLQNLINR